jgi:replication-associated recombination protein RarA
MLIANTLPKQLLFIGTYGIGKSTLAKLIARNLNAHIETYNVANLTGIDNVRESIIATYKRSTIDNKCKVFILDEIHKFSASAQEALLLPLEDESNTYFIACTTEESGLKIPLKKRFTAFRLIPPTFQERLECSGFVSPNINKDVRYYICQIAEDLRTVTRLSTLCQDKLLNEAKILCAAYDNNQYTNIVKSLMTIESLENYWEMLRDFGQKNGNWSQLLLNLINYYTIVFTNKNIDCTNFMNPILPGSEKARIYILSKQIWDINNEYHKS